MATSIDTMDLKTILQALPESMRAEAAKALAARANAVAEEALILAPWPLHPSGAPAVFVRGNRRVGKLQLPSAKLLGEKPNKDLGLDAEPGTIRGSFPSVLTWDRTNGVWSPRHGVGANDVVEVARHVAEVNGIRLFMAKDIHEARAMADGAADLPPAPPAESVEARAAVLALKKALPGRR